MCSSIVLLSVPVLLVCAVYVAGRVHLMRVVGWKNTIRTVLCRRSLFDGRQRLMPDYDRITVALRIPYSVRIQRQSDSTPSSYSIAVHRMAVMATNDGGHTREDEKDLWIFCYRVEWKSMVHFFASSNFVEINYKSLC